MKRAEVKLKVSQKQKAKLNHAYKGDILATSVDKEIICVLKGKADIISKGFTDSAIYDCVNGKQKTHKGFTFKRI